MSFLLCQMDDLIEGKWMTFSINESSDDESYMVKKEDNQLYVYHNFCPHQGRRLDYAPGEYLETPDKQVICPAHGATFQSEDGLCTGGPCAGDSLKSVPFSVRDRSVYIDVI